MKMKSSGITEKICVIAAFGFRYWRSIHFLES